MTIPDNLKQAVRAGKVIPFVGAGVSMAVRRRGGDQPLFPSWRQLLERAADRLEANGYEQEALLVRTFPKLREPKYLEAAEVAAEAFAITEWYKFLKENFDPNRSEAGEGLELARAIWSLADNLIITTNYDNVLSWACPDGGDVRRWLVQAPVQQGRFLKVGVEKPTVWHLHGGIEREETIILTPDGYSRLYPPHPASESPTKVRFKAGFDTLWAAMSTHTFLFIGYSLDDAEIGDQLRLINETFEGGAGQHFMLVRAEDRRDAEQRLSKLKGLIEFVEFEDFGPPLTRCVEELAAVRRDEPRGATSRTRKPPQPPAQTPPPQILPLPKLDRRTVERLFIGRERLLRDISVALAALTGSAGDRRGDPSAVDVQLFWVHGFGGMGKSWLLQRAYIEAEQKFPGVRLALIDWDLPQWRQPLQQPPIDSEQLFKVIAHRLAQLFGAEELRPYWEAEARVHASRERYTDLRLSFWNTLDRVVAARGGWARGGAAGARPSARAGEPGEAEGAAEAERRKKLYLYMVDVLRAAGLLGDSPEDFRSMVERLHDDPIRAERLFEAWAGLVAGVDADCADYRPGGLLAESLRGCLERLAARAPVLLILDTCELLPPELDWWLRRLLAPLLGGNTPLLVIVGSRQPPDADIPVGRSEGWLVEVPDSRRRIIPFNEQMRFTVDDIANALKKLRNPLPPDPELAGLLHKATLGLPLALRALFDFHETGDAVLGDLSFLQKEEPEDWDRTPGMQRVYERVSNRFLQHLERDGREEELRDVTALALFREARVGHLERFWDGSNVKERLRRLERRYSLVAYGDLHATVREFLRRRWRGDRHERVLKLARRFEQIVAESEPSKDFEEREYMEWLIDRCEVASWLSGQDAFPLFARTLAVALAHDHDPQALAALAAEIPTTSAAAEKSKRVLESLSGRYYPLAGPGQGVLKWLKEQTSAGWTDVERASLSLLNGLALASRASHAAAVHEFQEAFPAFVERPLPQKQRVALAYLHAVKELGQKRTAEAEEACQWAERLGLAADAWDADYYWVLHNAKSPKRYEEAVAYCRRVIELEPTNLSPRYFLGHVLGKHLKRAREAEEAYRDGLRIDDKSRTLHHWLAQLLADEPGRQAEAEAEYRTALKLSFSAKDKVSVMRDMAILFSLDPARSAEAEQVYREALKLADSTEDKVSVLKKLAHLLSNISARSADTEQACREGLRLASNGGDKAYLLYLLGYIQTYRLDQPRQAEESLRAALALVDDQVTRVSTLKTLAHLLINKLGRREEGLQIFRELLELSPDDDGILNSLAWALYFEPTRLEEAARMAARSVELAPGDLNSLHTYAAILVRMDRWDEALPSITEWVQKVSAERLRTGWHDFQPLFCDALEHGRAPALADVLESRREETTWALVLHALRAAAGGGDDFAGLPPGLRAAAAQLLGQLRAREPKPTFPATPDAPV